MAREVNLGKMRTGDKELIIILVIIIILWLLFRLLHQPQTTPGPAQVPGGGGYPDNMPGPNPVGTTPDTLTLNPYPGGSMPIDYYVGPQQWTLPGFPPIPPWYPGMTFLSEDFYTPGAGGYFPLFGFVGVDSTQLFQ